MRYSMRLWKNNCFILMMLCLGVISPSVFAQSFDQNFQEWKAKQQMYDQKLNVSKSSHSYGSKISQTNSLNDSTGQIHLNQATVNEFRQLKGIGEKKAQAIVEYRQKNGGFKNIDEIKNVKGVGPAIFEKNKSRLAL
ncbi:ComEA family DNA-binding protein [Acinetobacter nosocomialis]|uniref:ComEA family DNA-binding protein n=1 Tax=Acinetobacter nosocomialis TaxID=106654 RepID=UPI0026ED809E|nr:ComEA family DNA-binding protein [Acinetobacter nosocomialis]ELA7466336.1 ComEA family DNA-binding protein [Acinetobacter nosocomialis]MDO7219705.1 ComEA family DNA-binding protein [Acinetobacter nosocomialis]